MECHNNNNIRTINFKDAFGENSNIYDVFGDLLSIEEEGPTYEIPIQPLEPERDCSALMAETMKNRKTNFQHLVKQAEEEGLYGIEKFINDWAKEAYVLYDTQETQQYDGVNIDPNLQKGIDDIARNLLEHDDNTDGLAVPCGSIIEHGIIAKLYKRRYEVLLEDKAKEYGLTFNSNGHK